jgi:hypothetical protein
MSIRVWSYKEEDGSSNEQQNEETTDEDLEHELAKAFENPEDYYPTPKASPPAALRSANQSMKNTSYSISLRNLNPGRLHSMLVRKYNLVRPWLRDFRRKEEELRQSHKRNQSTKQNLAASGSARWMEEDPQTRVAFRTKNTWGFRYTSLRWRVPESWTRSFKEPCPHELMDRDL